MEENLQDIQSATFQTRQVRNVLEEARVAAEEAQKIREQSLVDDAELRRALTIVEEQLRQSKRLCQGGMAINAHLPAQHKFQDFSKVLPDYDFFTPDADADVKNLVHVLKYAGFEDVSARLGMHEGTTKIFVNQVAIADITEMPDWMYSILHKRALIDDGIQYVDADYLRLGMQLELSRPRGEVERWEKVQKRLLLLNQAKKPHTETCKHAKHKVTHMKKEVHESIVNQIIQQQLIFAGADLKRIQSHPNSDSAGYLVKSTNPILIVTDNADQHVHILRQMIRDQDPSLSLKIVRWKPLGDILPPLTAITAHGRVLVLLVTETACSAQWTVRLPNHKELRIPSLDAAITLFYQLTFVRGLEGLVPTSLHCFADSLVDLSMKNRDRGVDGKFPLFSIQCHGHQPTKASLLKAKAARIAEFKKTRKAVSSSTKKTAKPKTAKKRND